MKRVLASILMTVVLLLSLSAPAAAGLLISEPDTIVPLWSADENWTNPGSYVMDTENQLEGEGCVSINLKKGASIASRSFDPVDATGMLALEFDMYISDLAILDCLSNMHDVNGVGVQISSEGDAYKNEKNYTLTKIARSLKNGCPKVGWNHVIVFLDDMVEHYGPFDISHINYLRLSWINEESCDPNWILKFDNFVLTDRQVAPDPHTPGEWQYDGEKHWRSCVDCEEVWVEGLHCPQGGCGSAGKCKLCLMECGPFEHEYALGAKGDYSHIASKPTCTQAGRVYYFCRRCGEKSEETYEYGDPLGHDPKGIYQSCEAEGHSKKCSRCDEFAGEVKAHDFGNWLTLQTPTETEDGFERRHCQTCSYYEGQAIPKTGSQTTTPPNNSEVPDAPSKTDPAIGCSGVVGGVPLLAAMGFAVALAIKKKK